MKVHEVMTHPVVSLRPHTTVRKAAELLVSHGFRAAPVRTAEGEVLGIATEADLVRDRVVPGIAEGRGAAEHTVAGVMTPAPLCARPDDEVSSLALRMLRTGARSVLVMEGTRLVGIVTGRDVLAAVAGSGRAGRQRATTGTSERPADEPAELLLMRSAD